VLAALAISGAAGGCAARSPGDRAAERLVGHVQSRRLTCESRSAADLLAFHGLGGGEADVFARLPRSDNPDLGFVGDPDGPTGRLPPEGYGVHAEPLARALRALGLDATAGLRDYDWLVEETRAGRPVIVWVTGSCEPSEVTPGLDAARRPYRAVRGEHTMLVVAADGAGVTVVDPAEGARRRFARDEFESAWRLFDRVVVSATGPSSARPTR